MPELKYRAFWLGVGWLLIVAIVYLSLAPQPPQPLSFDQSDKLEHALGYAGLMLWYCQIYRKAAQRLAVGGMLVALGVALEILQGVSGYRSFEYADMLADTLGVLAGWGLARTRLARCVAGCERLLVGRS